jgi:histone deacetylase 1/2
MQALDAGPKQIDEAGVRVEQENVNKASSDQMFSKS